MTNGDQVIVDLTLYACGYTSCILDVNGYWDLFAVSDRAPPEGLHAKGTEEQPLDLGTDTHQGQVDTSACYYFIFHQRKLVLIPGHGFLEKPRSTTVARQP